MLGFMLIILRCQQKLLSSEDSSFYCRRNHSNQVQTQHTQENIYQCDSRTVPAALTSVSLCFCFSGNGPSGICLSYLLSGYTPYLSPEASHPNPLLHSKLAEQPHLSLLEQVKHTHTHAVGWLQLKDMFINSCMCLCRILSTCVKGWREDHPIPWPSSLIPCCSPTVTSGWTTPPPWNGDMSRSAPSLTWCWGRVHLEEPGM